MTKEWQDATQRGDCNRIRQLLDQGADINALDKYGQTALMNAARRGDFDLVDLLIKYGAELDHTAKYRLTALMLAVINDHKEIVKALIGAGANAELAGSKPFGCTPLQYAKTHGLKEIAGILKSVSSPK